MIVRAVYSQKQRQMQSLDIISDAYRPLYRFQDGNRECADDAASAGRTSTPCTSIRDCILAMRFQTAGTHDSMKGVVDCFGWLQAVPDKNNDNVWAAYSLEA